MRRSAVFAVLVLATCAGNVLAHGVSVGQTSQSQLAAIIEEPMPFAMGESPFPGVPGFAGTHPGLSSITEAEGDLVPLLPLSEVEFILVGADPGIQVWNDRGDAPMAIGDSFYLGFPRFSEHPVWNIHDGQLGDIKSVTLQLRDRTELAGDSAPIVLTFQAVPEPSAALLLALGVVLTARRRFA